jgi:hypothetical protein
VVTADNKRRVGQSASLGLLAVLLIAMAAPPVKGQSQEKPESELRVAQAGFIHAFDDLDWDHFRLTFLKP